MTDDDEKNSDTQQAWLVHREYTPRDLIVLEYATLDGERYVRKEKAARAAQSGVTAAIDVPDDKLAPTDDADVDRYRDEARRMQEQHDPDDEI